MIDQRDLKPILILCIYNLILETDYEEYLWITGGQTIAGAVSDVTDKLVVTDGNYQKVSDSFWKSGDDLQIPLAGHCLAKITDSLAMIAGGYSFDFQVKSSATIYNGNVISPENPWRNTG